MNRFFALVTLLTLVFCAGCMNDLSKGNRIALPDEKLGSLEMPENWEFIVEDGWISIIRSDTQVCLAIEEYRGNYDEWVYNDYFEYFSRIELMSEDYSGSTGAHIALYRYSTPEAEKELYTIFFQGNTNPGYSASFTFINEDTDINTLRRIIESYLYSTEYPK